MKELPILNYRQEIVDTVRKNQVTIIVGDTGSGKTTQVPQFLYEAFKQMKGKIGITQPRRVAAVSVACFVAEQLGCIIGEEVGYKIRFDNSTTEGTAIKFMTDGILLREIQVDPELQNYSVIMIDEAHERSLNTDFILGFLKDLIKKRTDLRIVVSSATIDEKKFSRYFLGAQVINVSGRMYPIEIYYQLLDATTHNESQIAEVVVETIRKILSLSKEGNILVFLTGEDDISSTVKKIKEQVFPGLICLPIFGNMNFEDQMLVFEQTKERKVVVATNIAETSITIDGIAYVIDAGWVKQTEFHPEVGIKSLDLTRISKSSALQRSGRAGRTQQGVCYRLYSQEQFNGFEDHTKPEIQRTDLAGIVLQMKMLGIKNIEGFDFIDPPDKEAFLFAYRTLIALGALDENNGVTEIGELMAKLPLEPKLARMVIAAKQYGCINEICVIAAALSNTRPIFLRSEGKKVEADLAHKEFRDLKSDFLTFLKVFKAYTDSGYDYEWCNSHFLNRRALKEMRKIREQLLTTLAQAGISSSSSDNTDFINKAVVAGLIQNICRRTGRYSFCNNGRALFIHPSSSLFNGVTVPEWIVAAEIIETTKTYARSCCVIDPSWIKDVAPQLCRKGLEYLFYDKANDRVEAIEYTFFEECKISQKHIELSGGEARETQAKRITEAEAKGWIKLIFSGEESGLWFSAEVNGIKYKTLLFSGIKEGKSYYCSIKTDDFWLRIFKEQYVKVEFEVLNFD